MPAACGVVRAHSAAGKTAGCAEAVRQRPVMIAAVRSLMG